MKFQNQTDSVKKIILDFIKSVDETCADPYPDYKFLEDYPHLWSIIGLAQIIDQKDKEIAELKNQK